jgi:PEP-CTERM motif-containing protein
MRKSVRACFLLGMFVVGSMGLCPSAVAGPFDGLPVEYWAGAGENEAVLCVDWNLGDSPTMIFGYRWAAGETRTGGDMLNAVDAASSRFHLDLQHFSFGDLVNGIGWDVDNDGFSESDPDDLFRPGWVDPDYWGYTTSANGVVWEFSMVGMGDRQLSDGSWDGWAYGSTGAPPNLVPEPATLMLVGSGCALMIARRRRRRK